MTDPDRILEILYDLDDAEASAADLRAAVGGKQSRAEEALKELQRRGQKLVRSPYGVRLERPVRLAANLIERDLGTRRVGRSVLCFEEVDSTNDVAMAAIGHGGPSGEDGLVVLAEYQRAGRGRHGRTWLSPPGQNILASVLLIDDARSQAGADGSRFLRHDAVTIACGVAAAEAVERATGLACELKWPNDVLLDGAKLAGVLVETRRHAALRGVVIGMGVNVNASPPPDAVDRPATSLAERLGHVVERVELVRALLRSIDEWGARVQEGDLETLHRAFVSRCRMIGQRFTIACGKDSYVGRVLDVDPLDGLALSLDDGTRVHLPAAGASVVG